MQNTQYRDLTHGDHCSIIPWSRILAEKLKVPQMLKEFSAFYGT
jgi:hypothetical protein